MMKNKSGLTAISRKKMSVPARLLLQNELLNGRVLDYGCGRGKDVEELSKKSIYIRGYDPNHEPFKSDIPVSGTQKYNTIMCNYVLNVVGPTVRKRIINHIKALLESDGRAYLTVRRDINADYVSSKGTHQYVVKLNLPVIKETSAYCIYELNK